MFLIFFSLLNFRKFFGRNWKEVLSPFLAINEVPSLLLRNEAQGAKYKVIKPHGSNI